MLVYSLLGFPEGSKQIYINNDNTYLYLCNDFAGKCNGPPQWNGDRSQFAIYSCNEPDRLYIVTSTVQEMVYLGFRGSVGSGSHIIFRIKDLAGSPVYTERSLPTSGAGYISTINQARVGPTQVYGAGGYTALSFRPTTPGVFYIEFDRVSNSTGQRVIGNFSMDLFDFTVCDTVALVVKPGRVYSKSWQFQESSGCSAKTYVYSADSIITSAEFNDMGGGVWIQFCNQWGCTNTGNFTNDRKSLYQQSALLPQYKIFINPPDALLYPPATTLGQIVSPLPWGERFCDNGHILFHVNVNKPGNVEIQLSFGPPYLSRKLQQTVVVGENLINWDGLDGTTPVGVPVPNGTVVTFTISYINGLTNMPFYDVETNSNGFLINLVSPAGSTPTVYWDDTNIPGGINNTVVGCVSPPGCHTWGNNWGNLNTINTYWYNVSSTTNPATIVEFRKPQPLAFNQSPPQSYCPGTNSVAFSVVPDPNTTVYHWSYSGTGATIIQVNPSDANVTVNFAANATSGSIQVYGTNSNCPGPGPTASLAITIKPVPGVVPPYAKSICSGTNVNLPLGSNPSGALFSWTVPPPTCSANIQICPPGLNNQTLINDLLTLTNLIPGTVTYHVIPTLNGCSGALQDIVISVNPLPDVQINSTTPSICSGETTNILLSSTVPGALFNWTATASSPNVSGYSLTGSGNILETISNSGFTTETVTYSIMPTVNGCTPASPTNYTVTVYPIPNVIINSSTPSICSAQTTNILLSSSVSGAILNWTTTASSPNITGFSPSGSGNIFETISNSGFTTETVTYSILPVANGCTPAAPTIYTITIFPVADVIFVPTGQTLCSGQVTNLSLQSNVAGATFTWTATPSSPNLSGFADGSGDLIAQIIDNAGATIEWVTYQVTPAANGCPPGTTMPVILTVNPRPVVTAVPNGQSICNGQATNLSLQADVTGSTFAWRAFASSANLAGFGSGSGNTIAQILTNNGFTPQSVTYRVAASANGCNGDSTDFIVVVYPVADVIFVPTGQALCSGQVTNLSLQSNVAGATFTWIATGSSPNVTGYTNGSGNLIQQTLFNSGYMMPTVTYQVAPTANGC
ncbi:MAG: PKD-like domain-containing protein, partial [Bacteroidota bacterium]